MKVLFAKIDPPAEIVKQDSSLFSHEIIKAEYFTAIVDTYMVGVNDVFCKLIFGNLVFNDQGEILTFRRVTENGISLKSNDLQNWGTDDEIILSKICDKLGINLVESVEVEFDFCHFC